MSCLAVPQRKITSSFPLNVLFTSGSQSYTATTRSRSCYEHVGTPRAPLQPVEFKAQGGSPSSPCEQGLQVIPIYRLTFQNHCSTHRPDVKETRLAVWYDKKCTHSAYVALQSDMCMKVWGGEEQRWPLLFKERLNVCSGLAPELSAEVTKVSKA